MSELGDLVRQITDKTGDNLGDVLVELSLVTVKSLMFKSPVETGRFRGNWVSTSTRPSRQIHKSIRRESTVRNEAVDKMIEAVGNGTTWNIVNNLPYARVIEYGLYPSPVKKGTRNRKTGVYEIRSANGFSKQAPAGVVRITKKKLINDLRKLVLRKQQGK